MAKIGPIDFSKLNERKKSTDKVDKIKRQISTYSLASKVTQLKEKNGTFKGLCPFHTENTPSFSITENPEGGDTFHCFGCGVHGDVIDFYALSNKISNEDSIRSLYKTLNTDIVIGIRTPVKDNSVAIEKARREAEAKIAKAKAIYDESTPLKDITDKNNPAWLYLRRRYINLFDRREGITANVRYHNSLYNELLQVTSEALVVGVYDNGRITGITRIYISKQGYKLTNHKACKLSLGSLGAGYAPLWASEGSNVVVMTEGTEDGLALADIQPNYSYMACLGLHRLGKVKIPSSFSKVIVGADKPKNEEQKEIVDKAVEALKTQISDIEIRYPEEPHKDFNDWIIAKRTKNIASESPTGSQI